MSAVLDHVGIESTDIDADVAMYVDTFGGTLLRWGVHVRTGGRIAMVHLPPGVKIELMEVPERTGALSHTAFRTQHSEEFAPLVQASGRPLIVPTFRIEAARADACTIGSPGGEQVQLIAYDDDSPDVVREPES